jgi:hypothetical protein
MRTCTANEVDDIIKHVMRLGSRVELFPFGGVEVKASRTGSDLVFSALSGDEG